ncbi:hypothetical protein CHU98_g3619 [Xylaria longipes]|nr:hypothetical protein CHU98_g3619 [Xylaria longipes]
MVRLLLENGANINMNNNHKNRPLNFAINTEDEDLVRFLLDNGAEPQYFNRSTRSLLSRAKYFGLTAIAKLLRERGARY